MVYYVIGLIVTFAIGAFFAFTETEDGKHYIDVEADLINHKIIRSIDNQLVEELKYGSLSELIEKELYGMSFDDLVYFTDEQLAPFYQSPDALMEEANILQDFFIYSKADDIAVSVQNETVVAADGENEWKGKEIYDFILNEMLAFNEDGTLADGLTVPEDMLEFIKKTGVEKYGVEYAVIIEVDEPEQEAFADFLARIHAEDDGKTVALLPLGDFYESYGADAEAIAETLDFQATHKTVEGVEYALCGFPKHRLEENVEVLTEKGFDVILVDDDGNPHKVISRDKALGLPESTAPAEVIEEPDEDAPEEVPEGLRWDEGTAMRIAQEEWEKAHRPPVHRPTYEQRNYNFMREFAPAVLEGSVRYALYESKSFMPIHISRLSEDSIRIAHTYEQNGDLMYDPEMIFEIDEDNEALKPLEYRQDNMGIFQVVGENVTDRELSSFAVQWFKNIRSQGFHLAMERLEYADADIEVSYNEKGEIINVEGEENSVALYIEENGVEFPVDETAELVGKEITIDDRKFIVDSVNEFGSVSLKDITFENVTGFPIFRRESVEFVKAALEQQKDAEKIVPEFEKVQPSKVANTVVYPEIPMAQRTNFVIDNDELGYGGAKEKFRKNMEAIRVLKECEFEHRLATPDEQKILSEYVGWGGLADAFDETKSNWADEFQELYAALSPEEYEQARASTLTSHYTSPVIIKSMYKALENMGFSQGNILEPSCGIGNFMGLVPESMKDSKIYGIELDSITGRIAQQLYQRNSIAIQGYEDTTLPDSFFDVAIGNVPFGDYKLLDKKYNKHNFLIHDYFFAKTLDKVRPGGIVAFITSSGTMDKRNSKVRQYIAQRADLVGAIRLPNNAFLKNAGTEVTADILFLQKRDRMTDIMPDWVHLGTLENGIAVNQYFADNPDMILGEMQMVSGPFGPTPTCMPYEDVTLGEQLNEAIQNIHATITEYEIDDVSNDEEMTIPADPEVRNFSFTLVDGDVYFRENSFMRKVELNATAQNRIKGMIAIRDCVRTLIEYQTEGYPDWEIQKQQEKLNTIYDDFTKKYGLINSRGNSMAFSDDSSYFLLCSLEVLDENGELERKADMFTKRTIGAKQEITKVDTSSEALAVSLGEKAKIDMEFMSSLTGKTEDELYEDLKGVIFLNPHYNEDDEPAYLTADEYLSGNVREKLSVVKDLAIHDEACPWRPADLEQRAGRIIRQGNTNSDVHIRRYVTKDTFDSYMWQLVENKQKFIGQIMTSKSPVRSAEDIDEMALSYAEIKALTTGNPYIKEKMDLDTQVAKLKLIKSSFMSQKYELEDKVIKEYPRTIADLTERIKGFEGDIAIAENYPKQEDVFYPMTIDGLPYTDKEKAGTALLERCKKMTSPEPTPIGDYRGFSMDLSFDTTTKVFYVSLKGHLSHKVELGTDVFGNMQRLDNALEGLPKRLEVVKENLEETKKQFETAKVESQKEFPQEAELQEKIKRLAEVEVLLDMDKKDREGADLGEPDEAEIPLKKVVGLER